MRTEVLSTLSLAQADRYRQACRIAPRDDAAAEQLLQELLATTPSACVRAQLQSDLAAITTFRGHDTQAVADFANALQLDPECATARDNLALLRAAKTPQKSSRCDGSGAARPRIAVLSLLFNWPSTGGGTVHTKELVDFLQRDGYDVRHIYAVQREWGLGHVAPDLGPQVQPVEFSIDHWQPDIIRERFRQQVDRFAPDYVIITDSWNTKVLLAEAVRDYAYFLRIAALECLCPLNNVRLLVDDGQLRQCQQNQLATPLACRTCVASHGEMSGGLHRAERSLAGFELQEYPERLRRAFAEAEGVLVVNPFIADLVRPHTQHVHVIPSGFDVERFPCEINTRTREPHEPLRILFAGLTQELMKGYFVLQQAAELLWSERQNFELWVTADPEGMQNAYTRHVGWQSQENLPQIIAACDLLVFPTIAQEALGRTAVEAMGCGRPVVASRLGGLAWVVDDGVTGLLATPGDPVDLARQIARLLDDGALRERMGQAGREKFEREFTWEVILQRYAALFGAAARTRSGADERVHISGALGERR